MIYDYSTPPPPTPLIYDYSTPTQVKRRVKLLNLISLRRPGEVSDFHFPENMDAIESQAGDLDGAEPRVKEIAGAVVDSTVSTMIGMFIHELGLVAELSQVDKVISVGKGAFPSMYVAYLHSRWCFNVGKEHQSNRVYVQIKSGLKLTMRCHNASDLVSDQNFRCCEYEEPYTVFNSALNFALFGRVPRPFGRPTGTISNAVVQDPLVQWLHEFAIDVQRECSRDKNRARAATMDDASQAERNAEEYEDDDDAAIPKRRRRFHSA